nr:MAG TPA: hypothetical protein [Caudoviricetes sp.]
MFLFSSIEWSLYCSIVVPLYTVSPTRSFKYF